MRRERGFTLIEIMISMFLLSLCLALLLQLFPLAQSLARSSDVTFQASMIAQGRLEAALLADSSTWQGDSPAPSPHDDWTVRTRSAPLVVNQRPDANNLVLQVSIYSGDACLYELDTVAAR